MGYQAGQYTLPLFGADWDPLWDVPIEELRTRFEIDLTGVGGEGVREAASRRESSELDSRGVGIRAALAIACKGRAVNSRSQGSLELGMKRSCPIQSLDAILATCRRNRKRGFISLYSEHDLSRAEEREFS